MKNIKKIIFSVLFLSILLYIVFNAKHYVNIYNRLYIPPWYYKINWFNNTNLDSINTVTGLYKLRVYKAEATNNYALILDPQNMHIFIENGKIIYHPLNNSKENILKGKHLYYCHPSPSYELAYVIPISSGDVSLPKLICHRNLTYLMKYVYIELIYSRLFETVQNPLDVISNFFITIQKIEGLNQISNQKYV